MKLSQLITNCGFHSIVMLFKADTTCLHWFFLNRSLKEGVLIIWRKLLWMFWKNTNVFDVNVVRQIQNKYVPHLKCFHCMAHYTNLTIQSLSQIFIMKCKKNLFQSFYSFFFHNLRRHLEFLKLVNMMKVKRSKILWNVQTCWVNMLNSTKQVMSMYMPLIAKMV